MRDREGYLKNERLQMLQVLGSTAANLDDNDEGGLGGICNYWGFSCTLYVVIKDAIQLYYSIRRSSVNEGVQRQGIRIAGGVNFSRLTTEKHPEVRLECDID